MIRVVRPEGLDRVYTSERLRRQLTAAWPAVDRLPGSSEWPAFDSPHREHERAIITRS
jgi:hypothetical protein